MLITRKYSSIIDRPIDEVRRQFCDMTYHVATNVHPDLRFTIHSTEGEHCAFRREITLAGMHQTDEVVSTLLPDGTLQSDVVSGMNTGGRLAVSFQENGPASTRLSAVLTIPANGLRALVAPLIGVAAQRALEKGFAEDKRDLEAGNYERYTRAASA